MCQTVEECKSELHCRSPLSTFRQRFQLTPLQQYTNRLSHPSFSYIFPFFSWLSLSHFCLYSGMFLLASSECVRMVKRIQADRDLLHAPFYQKSLQRGCSADSSTNLHHSKQFVLFFTWRLIFAICNILICEVKQPRRASSRCPRNQSWWLVDMTVSKSETASFSLISPFDLGWISAVLLLVLCGGLRCLKKSLTPSKDLKLTLHARGRLGARLPL